MVSLGISSLGCRTGCWHAEAQKGCWACLRSHKKLAGAQGLGSVSPQSHYSARSRKPSLPSADPCQGQLSQCRGGLARGAPASPGAPPGSARDVLRVAVCPSWHQLSAWIWMLLECLQRLPGLCSDTGLRVLNSHAVEVGLLVRAALPELKKRGLEV